MYKKLLIRKKNKKLISLDKNKKKIDEIFEDFYNIKNIIIPNEKINIVIEKKDNKIVINNIFPYSCLLNKIEAGDQILGLNNIIFNNKSLDEVKKIFKNRGDNNILKIIKKNDSI